MARSYYQLLGCQERYYVLLDSLHNAHLDPDLIVQIKFSMRPQDHRVQGNDQVHYLDEDDEDMILAECRRRLRDRPQD